MAALATKILIPESTPTLLKVAAIIAAEALGAKIALGGSEAQIGALHPQPRQPKT